MRVIIFIFLILFSCGKTHKLENKEISINPYKVGDKLVFRSTEGLIDTVSIIEIVRNIKSLEYFKSSPKGEGLSVIAAHSIPTLNPFKEINNGSLLMINNYGEGPIIDFWFPGNTKAEAISKPFTKKSLDTLKLTTLTTAAGTFDDVIIIMSDTIYPESFDRLSKIYWSKQFGYIRIEINDKYIWDLENKWNR